MAVLKDPEHHDIVPPPRPPSIGFGRRPKVACAATVDGASHTFLYFADCSSLRAWSAEVGFRVIHASVAPAPDARIETLLRVAHAGSTRGSVRPDADAADWRLCPIHTGLFRRALPSGCEYDGHAIRVTLPPGATSLDLAARLAVLLSPLDALTAGQAPSAVLTRALHARLRPILPRYTCADGRPRLARDVYRVHRHADVDYVLEALEMAVLTLGSRRAEFDRALHLLGSCPGAEEFCWAATFDEAFQ